MSASKTVSIDLDALLADFREREASGIFAADGRVLAWSSAAPEKADAERSSVIPAVLRLAATAQAAGLPYLDRILIEGPKRKILIVQTQPSGAFLALMGGESMNVGLAVMKLKQVSSALEASLMESK